MEAYPGSHTCDSISNEKTEDGRRMTNQWWGLRTRKPSYWFAHDF